jgi:hypothetical protein
MLNARVRPCLAALSLGSLLALPLAAEEGENPAARKVHFGDLHVHTSYSFDSYVNVNRNTPDDAYNFAKGREPRAARLAEDGPFQPKLRAPLDFAAVTDHAEYLGEMAICLDPALPGFTSPACEIFRDKTNQGQAFNLWAAPIGLGVTGPPFPFCQDPENPELPSAECAAAARAVWGKLIEIANRHYEPGKFTTFVAYEWSALPDGGGVAATAAGTFLHRNVIFRTDSVPQPISALDTSDAVVLWQRLKAECNDNPDLDCEAITIPHNSNYSNGYMFDSDIEEPALRAAMEPVAEVMQTKGESMCRTGVGTTDELCDFEKIVLKPLCLPGQDPADGQCVEICPDPNFNSSLTGNTTCVFPQNYVRNALKEGMRLAQPENLGVNPYKVGFIGSTDTHNGIPGGTQEDTYLGQHASTEARAVQRLALEAGIIKRVVNNPGALAAVYAEENTREALFAGLQRKETYGTSGTRLQVRLFGGWDLPADACDRHDLIELGYQKGVPMGGDLPPGSEGKKGPTFVAWAMQDPNSAPLAKLQLVKGWVPEGGQESVYQLIADNPRTAVGEAIYDLACATSEEGGHDPAQPCPASGATVNTQSCTPVPPPGPPATELCATFTDPDFDPNRPAFYYLRVVEQPTCRWSTYDCNGAQDQFQALFQSLSLPPGSTCNVVFKKLGLNACQVATGATPVTNGNLQIRSFATCCCPQLIPTTIQERAWSSPIWYTPSYPAVAAVP